MLKKSIKLYVAATISSVIALIVIVIQGYNLMNSYKTNVSHIETLGQSQVEMQADALAIHLWNIDDAQARELLNKLSKDVNFGRAWVLEKANKGDKGTLFVEVVDEKYVKSEDDFHFTSPVTYKSKTIGELNLVLTAAQMKKDQKAQLIQGVLVTIGSVAFIFICVFITVGFVTKPILALEGSIRSMAEGNYDVQIRGLSRRDEIGVMAKSIDKFREKLIDGERLKQEQKEAAERQAKEKTQMMEKLANNFQDQVGKIIEDVSQEAQKVKKMAGSVSGFVKQASDQSASVRETAENTSVSVNTVSSSTEEMSYSIQESAENLTRAVGNIGECVQAAQHSQKLLDELQKAISDVDDVINAITEVSEQTSLLALNATIESARAGEAGKGFAVVANEVKSLASETKKMTESISQTVDRVKNSSKDTVHSLGDILRMIEDINKQTTAVSSAVEEQSAATQEISKNIQTVATSTDDVTKKVGDINVDMSKCLESTVVMDDASGELAKQADSLNHSVESFLKSIRES